MNGLDVRVRMLPISEGAMRRDRMGLLFARFLGRSMALALCATPSLATADPRDPDLVPLLTLPLGHAPACPTPHVAILQPRVPKVSFHLPVDWATVIGDRAGTTLVQELVLVDRYRPPMQLPMPPNKWNDAHIAHTIGGGASAGPAGGAMFNPDMGVYGWARTPEQRVHVLKWRPPMYPGEDSMVVETLGVMPEEVVRLGLATPGPGGEVYGTATSRLAAAQPHRIFHVREGVVTFVSETPMVGGGTAAIARPPRFDSYGNRFGLVVMPNSTEAVPAVWRRDPATGAPGTHAKLLPLPAGASRCYVTDANGPGLAVGLCGSVRNYDQLPASGSEQGILWALSEAAEDFVLVPGTVPSMLTAVLRNGTALGKWLHTEDVVDFPLLMEEGAPPCDLWASVVPGHGLSSYIETSGMADDGSVFFVGADTRNSRGQHATIVPIYENIALSGPYPAERGVPAVLTATDFTKNQDQWLYVSGDAPEDWTSWPVPGCPEVMLPFEPDGPPVQPTAINGATSTFAWTPPANGVYPMWARVVDHTTCVASQTHPLVVLD